MKLSSKIFKLEELEAVRLANGFVEKAFTIMALLLYSGAFTYFIASTNPLYIYVQLISWAIFLLTLFLTLKRWKVAIYALIQEKLLLPLVGLVILSSVWSILPISETWYRVGLGGFLGNGILPFLQITLFGIYFATRYTLSQQLRLLAWMFGSAALFSIIVAVILPSYGVMGALGTVEDALHAGAWRGVYVHKNVLGNMMVLGGVIFLVLSQTYQRHRLLLRLGFIFCVGLIFLSTSKTALVTIIMLGILLPLYKALRWSDSKLIPFAIFILLIAGCLIAFISTNFEFIMISLGRDPTLTGRSIIWSAVAQNIQQRFWFGHGYNTFWIAVRENLITVWFSVFKLKPSHGHNGFLDLWLDLGFAGFSIFLIGFFTNCFRAIQYIRLTISKDSLLPLLFLTYIVQINQSESYLIRENFLMLLYVSTAISLSMSVKTLLQHKKELKKQTNLFLNQELI